MHFYHYTKPNYVLESLIRNRLKIATLDSVNDPYEMLPCVKTQGGIAAPTCIVRERMRDILKETGMVCLSATAKSPAMWAHYAERHRGVAFEMEFPETELKKVNYVEHDERVVFAAERIVDQTNFKTFAEELIARKAHCWAYEKEYRWVFPLQSPGVFMDDNGRFFRHFPKELRRVILGADCTLNAGAVRKALNEVGFDDVLIDRARLSDRMFAVEIDPPAAQRKDAKTQSEPD